MAVIPVGFHSKDKQIGDMTETKFLGRLRVKPGQSLFALNIKTGEITDMGKPRRVNAEQGIVYRVALNRKSFIKKLIREGILLPTYTEPKQ